MFKRLKKGRDKKTLDKDVNSLETVVDDVADTAGDTF
jgi:hypothetical protein